MELVYKLTSVVMFSKDLVWIFFYMSNKNNFITLRATVVDEGVDIFYKRRKISEVILWSGSSSFVLYVYDDEVGHGYVIDYKAFLLAYMYLVGYLIATKNNTFV